MALGTILAGVGAANSLYNIGKDVFGGDDDDGGGGGSMNRGSRLRKIYEDRLNRLQGQSPTETASFQSGSSALREGLEREAERDASQAAARGLTGSQFEVAQDQNRARTLGRQTRRLVGQSERRLSRDRSRALSGLMEASAFEEDIRARRRRMDARKNSRLANLVGSALQAGATIFAGTRGGGGGGG